MEHREAQAHETNCLKVTVMSSVNPKPTLYDRLGGVYSIATVVDDFIDRVMRNPVLNANAAVDEAHHRVSAAGFKYYVIEMVCWATGGPQKYAGRSMLESHEHLKITESEWDAFCKDFDDIMAKFSVPEAEREELFAIVLSTKGDIVRG
jgi:hemoglobin